MKSVEGQTSIRHLMELMFTEAQETPEVCAISNIDLVQFHFPEFTVLSANPARIDRGIPSRLIYTGMEPLYASTDILHNRQSRFVLPEFLVDMSIIGDYVMFIEMTEVPVKAYYNKDKVLADQLRKVFGILWDI